MYHKECDQHDGIETRDYKEGAQIWQEPDRVNSKNSLVLVKLLALRPDVFKLGKHLSED